MESDNIPPSTLLAFIKPEADLAEAREVRTIFEGAVGRTLKERVQAAKASGINSVSYKISSGKPTTAPYVILRE
jgi:hypothetical protein